MENKIPHATIIRLLSVFFVGSAYAFFPNNLVQAFFISALFGHYALAFFYAKDQAKNLIQYRPAWIPLLILAGFGAAYIGSGMHVLGLIPFIGFHITLSEIYMVNQLNENRTRESPVLNKMNLSRFSLNLSIYVLLLHHQSIFSWIPLPAIHGLLLISLAWLLIDLWKKREKLGFATCLDYGLYEVSGAALAYYLFFREAALTQQIFVSYHVSTWIFFPAWSFSRRKDSSALLLFGGLTLSSTGLFFFLLPNIDLKTAIPLWASVHFLSSFALSNWNPQIISRWFYPRTAQTSSRR